MMLKVFINFIAALLIKTITYFVISLLYLLILLWAGVIKTFSWKYVIALSTGLLLFRIFIAEVFIKTEKINSAKKKL